MLKCILPGSLALCACTAACPPCAQTATHGATHEATPRPGSATESASPVIPSADASKRPGHASSSAAAQEARTTEVIAAVVTENRASVRRCYEQTLTDKPGIQGTLTLRFTLDSQGKVTSADINPERSTIRLPSLTQCAANAVRQMPFPPSSRGFESTVNYQFTFKP